MRKVIVPGIIIALLATAGFTMFSGDERKTLTASFPRAISVYEGSDVRILGVPVGTVDTVTPSGTDVTVTMSYESDQQIPADAQAVIIAPSVVGDRYVQLTPVFRPGDQALEDGAKIQQEDTQVPLELDQIYSSLNELNVALGPTGANRNGALTDLLEVTAENFGGQGEKFNQTIEDFSKFSQTLDNNKEELFGSAERLQGFISTLARNDKTVRQFNQSLADVSGVLEGEREELRAALRNLGTALGEVSTFVRDNRAVLGRNIGKLNQVAEVLVKRRGELDQVLGTAPLALNNLALTYNPQTGTLDTRSNQGELEEQLLNDPIGFICQNTAAADISEQCNELLGEVDPRRAPAFGARGPRVSGPDPFDPTLGGLVEVQR